MSSGKLKASAIVVSFFIGAILSIILVSSLLSATEGISLINKHSNFQLARLVSENGISTGINKYHELKNDPVKLFADTNRSFGEIDHKKTYNDLTVEIAPLSVGSDLTASSWLKDSTIAKEQRAYEVSGEQSFEINLIGFMNKDITERPQAIKVFFSDAFKLDNEVLDRLSDDQVNRFEYILTRDGEEVKKGSEATDKSHELDVQGLESCVKGSNCLLKLNFQVSPQHIAFLKIKAENSKSDFNSTSDEPGTVYIHSIGYAGGVKADLIYKISSSGKNLGLFEEGVYCESECRIK